MSTKSLDSHDHNPTGTGAVRHETLRFPVSTYVYWYAGPHRRK